MVTHQRTRPVRNGFRYGLYYLYLDLAELEMLDRDLKRFGHNRRALVSLFDADHGPRDGSPLRPWIDSLLTQAGIDLEGGRVSLLTFPRVLGFRFYPVSFWYCFHADGTPRAVLAEVQNTYRDHHNYLLHAHGEVFDWHTRPEATKAFFVSPFIQLEDVRYQFHFSEPGPKLSASIYDVVDGEGMLTAAISLSSLPLTDASLAAAVRRMGPMSLRALILIHWQAVRLLLKGMKLVDHTPPPEKDTSL
ncbi:MAG: DUF1365 domain-containing protein [Actinobacteria bacterium HGW-Actinobacteria-7]|jgi:hypothetical protein|nr:MAG: DUF1365 domain-containing protein [Actinobacteria bacterium HGW-Actinobacteria-7]